jgi:hypothetical protein
MRGERPTRLTLELDSAVEPIQGRMRGESGPSRHFVGWLGLAAALRGVLEEPAPAPPRERVAKGEQRTGRRGTP